jgi:Domain of unknown function (DUF4350)
MTATLADPRPGTPAPPARRARRPRSWRWLRLVIPFAMVFAVVVGCSVVHSMAEPDVTDPAFLSPASGAPIGAQHLADLLGRQGVTIERVTRSSDALVRAYQGDVTLFVPAPSLMHPYYVRMLKLLPASTRVVLVEPSALTLGNGHVPVFGTGSRWAPAAVAPACALPEARAAGVAGIYHTYYGEVDGAELGRCYGSALLDFRYALAEVVLVGSSDVFRNDRIGEYGNATLATGLLGTNRTVVWLDLHRSDPPPGVVRQAPDPGLPAAPPSLGTGGSPDPDFPVADPHGIHRGDPGPGPVIDDGGDSGDDGGAPATPPFWKLLPPWAWTGLGLLALAGLAYALARARRLGPPVSEPLPVAVRASETVEGRGRLYQRAQARGSALDALRPTALHRLRLALGLAPETPTADVVAAVAARTGRPPWVVDAILSSAVPADDAELVHLTHQVDDLVRTVTEMAGDPR